MKLEKYLYNKRIKLIAFAKYSNLKVSYLSQIKNGKKTPSLKTATKIVKATKNAVTFKDLIS